MCRWYVKLIVKSLGLTEERQLILAYLRMEERSGILGVAVKCVDLERNTDGEGSFLVHS